MKKFLFAILSVLCFTCLSLGLTACGGNDNTDGDKDGGVTHTHVQASTGFDDSQHYSICSCGEKFDHENHQVKSIDFNATHHYSICACGAEFNKREHMITGNKELCQTCGTTVVYDADSFQNAIDLTQYYDMHISFANDVDLNGFDWLSPAIRINSTRTCTIDGRNFAIIGLNSSIYDYTYGMKFIVKNLTFKNATVTDHEIENNNGGKDKVASLFSSEMLRMGKGCDYTFNNVHVVDCNITTANYGAAFVAYSNGGKIEVVNCSFKGTITGAGSVGVVVGHSISDLTVDGLEIKMGSVISCTDDRGETGQRKAGSVFGTSAHSHDVFGGVQTITVKNVTNNGSVLNVNGVANEHNTDIYGRIVQPDNSKGSCADCVIEYNE